MEKKGNNKKKLKEFLLEHFGEQNIVSAHEIMIKEQFNSQEKRVCLVDYSLK